MATSKVQKEVAERLIFSANANAYSTYALALVAMETAFDGLTDVEKRNSYILYGANGIKAPIDVVSSKQYTRTGTDENGMIQAFFDLKNHQRVTAKLSPSSFTSEDISSSAQTIKMALYTVA